MNMVVIEPGDQQCPGAFYSTFTGGGLQLTDRVYVTGDSYIGCTQTSVG